MQRAALHRTSALHFFGMDELAIRSVSFWEMDSNSRPRNTGNATLQGGRGTRIHLRSMLSLLMGIEIRLFPVIDAFSAFSGMPLACSERLSLPLAKQLLDSSGAARGCLGVPTQTGSQSIALRRSEEARFAPKIRRFLVPVNR